MSSRPVSSPEEFYASLAQTPMAQPEAAAPTPAPPPELPTVPNAPPAQGAPPEPAPPPTSTVLTPDEEKVLDTDLEGWIDPVLHEQLKNSARGQVTTEQAFALAALAAANPDLARTHLSIRAAEVQNARNVLANLQSQAQHFRRSGTLQKGMYERTLITTRQQQVQEMQDAANRGGVTVSPPPADLTDDKAFTSWVGETQRVVAEGGAKTARGDRLRKITESAIEEARRQVRQGAAPETLGPDWLKSYMRLSGADEKDVTEMEPLMPAVMSSIKTAAMQTRAEKAQEVQLARARIDSSMGYLNLARERLRQGEESLKTRNTANVLNAAEDATQLLQQSIQSVPFLLNLAEQAKDETVKASFIDAANKQGQLQPILMKAIQDLRARATGLMESKDMGSVYWKSTSSSIDWFLEQYPTLFNIDPSELGVLQQTPQYEIMRQKVQDWLFQNPNDPRAQRFWDETLMKMKMEFSGKATELQLEEFLDDAARTSIGRGVRDVTRFPRVTPEPGSDQELGAEPQVPLAPPEEP